MHDARVKTFRREIQADMTVAGYFSSTASDLYAFVQPGEMSSNSMQHGLHKSSSVTTLKIACPWLHPYEC